MNEEAAYYGITISGGGGMVNWIVPVAVFKLMKRDNLRECEGTYDVFADLLKKASPVEVYVNWPLVAWIQSREVQPQWAGATEAE